MTAIRNVAGSLLWIALACPSICAQSSELDVFEPVTVTEVSAEPHVARHATPKWVFDAGGYVKLDTIFDFNAIGSTDFFAPNQIPTDGTKGQNFRMHARQTRLNLEARHKMGENELRLFVEGDFYGTGNAFRLRHGYAQYGQWLAGQSWTTFMDEIAMPDLINFESPSGELITRRAQLRWTRELEGVDGGSFSMAVEDPSPVFSPVTGRFENALPDFVMRGRIVRDSGHFQMAGFVSGASFETNTGVDSDDVAWGAALSGSRKIGNYDSIRLQASIGEGYERFRGFQSYDLTTTGDLFAVPAYAYSISYEHHWTSELKSVVVYSLAETDAGTGISGIAKSVEYVAANLLWKPNEHFRCGVEYLWGSREEFDGTSGTAHRIQFGAWYYLP